MERKRKEEWDDMDGKNGRLLARLVSEASRYKRPF
jgi:hypothetical protein